MTTVQDFDAAARAAELTAHLDDGPLRDLDEPPVDPYADLPPIGDADQQTPLFDPDLFVFRSLAEVAADVRTRPKRQFLFAGAIVAGDYGVLSAEDKAGKTFSVLDAAISCAAGLPWLGHYECQTQGAVLLFLGEGSDAKMLRRIYAIGRHKGLTEEQIEALPIRLCFRIPFLAEGKHLGIMDAQLRHYPVELVVLDPLYLAARGGKGSDLFAMGEMLGNAQRIVQAHKATLLINHHWNKTGEGSGHNRSSGVGPGAWGRFLISVGVLGDRHTDPETKMTTVKTKWSIRGDEIADSDTVFVRRVWVDDPDDLDSAMHYSVEVDQRAAASPGEETQDAGSADWRPTKCMEAVSKRLEGAEKALSRNVLETTISGYRNDIKRSAIELLVAEGFVAEEKKTQARLYTSIKPFRASAETAGAGLDLTISEQRVLNVLKAASAPIGIRAIGDEIATDGLGSPLRVGTLDKALNSLAGLGHAELVEVAGRDGWVATPESPASETSPDLAPTSPDLAPGEVDLST